jgi:hypothetical protein
MRATERAAELVQLFTGPVEAADPQAFVTDDPRAVTAPCVLITPPARRWDRPEGSTATWSIVCLAAGDGGAATWDQLDDLVDAVVGSVLDDPTGPVVDGASFGSYQLRADAPPIPCYIVTLTEGLD